MTKQTVTIKNPTGLHMRPAGVFAQEMGVFSCDILIRHKSNLINAKSLLSIMAECIKRGDEIDIECDGPDENEALSKAVELIEGFTE